MATLAKPKQKEKTKSKTKDDEITEDTLEKDLENLNLDFSDLLPTAPMQEEEHEQEEHEKEIVKEETETEKVFDSSFGSYVAVDEPKSIPLLLEEQIPSAPVFDEKPLEVVQSPVYPFVPRVDSLTDEQKLHRMNEYFVNVAGLKPLSQTEMKELYHNPYLTAAESLENDFVEAELQREARSGKHILYELLMKYSRSHKNLKMNILDINEARMTAQKQYGHVWVESTESIRATAKCGDEKNVSIVHHYKTATMKDPVYNELRDTLKNLQHLCTFVYSSNLFNLHVCRYQIQNRIKDLLASNAYFLEVTSETPVTVLERESSGVSKSLNEIRLSISILFAFLRRPNLDPMILLDVKEWIQQLVTLLLRFATWNDHLFILYHVLRCSVEIASWAACLIQVPKIRSGSTNTFHHVLTILSALLTPTKRRNDFISKHITDPVAEDVWVLIDSDGEDEGNHVTGPRENDVIAIFNQIPLQELFACITCAAHKEDGFQVDSITGQHVLQSIGFCTKVIEYFGQGLRTFEGEKYRQFSKRLARTIKDVVLYITEMQEILNTRTGSEESASLRLRIHLEHNQLVLKACYWIYRSQKVGTWQFLTGIPFELLSKEALYKLYYAFNKEFTYEMIGDLRTNYAEKVHEAEANLFEGLTDTETTSEDVVYLLQLFGAMASSRDDQDWDLITTISVGLYKIGFIIPETTEICHRTARDLLGNLATSFPQLISLLLDQIKTDIAKSNPMLPYLIKGLPLELWHPLPSDLDTISLWLLNFCFESVESQVARIIFNRLNWNFTLDACTLFLGPEIHLRTARLICEVASKHVPETIGLSGINMTSLVRDQTARQQFSHWCWNMASRLRLHAMDQGRVVLQQMMTRPEEILVKIPELDATADLCQCIGESRPLAIYLSLLITMCGHSVPQICERGFAYLKLLLSDSRHAIVIRCLELLTPLFLACPDSLSGCDMFQSILSALLNDQTYARHTKDFVVLTASKPVLQLMSDMVQAQVISYAQYGFQTPTPIIDLWVRCLTYGTAWYINNNYVHLMDLLLRIAYQFPDAWISVRNRIQPLFTMEHVKQDTSGFMAFISGGTTFLQPSPQFPWISLMFLEIEFEVLELQSGIWHEIIRQPGVVASKTNLTEIVRKAARSCGISEFQPHFLVIYKTATLITNCTITNPLLPLFCQLFFTLYFARIPITPGDLKFYAAFDFSEKFFDHAPALMKKVRKKLQESNNLKTFVTWFDNPNIKSYHANNIPGSVPNAGRLMNIFEGNRAHWSDLIDLPALRKQQLIDVAEWSKVILRPTINVRTSSLTVEVQTPKARIAERLETYSKPIPPPAVYDVKADPPAPKAYLNRKPNKIFQKEFKTISKFAFRFNQTVEEHRRIDSRYLNLVKELYRNEARTLTKRVLCGIHCMGVASNVLRFTEAVLNDTAKRDIETNRSTYNTLLIKEFADADQDIVIAISQILDAARNFAEKYEEICDSPYVDPEYRSKILQNGVRLFYEMLNEMQEQIFTCPISKDVVNHCAEKLGVFVRANHNAEGFNLLDIAIKQPHLINIISEQFVPTVSPAPYFTGMYETMIVSHFTKCDGDVIFVLFTKFDVQLWLKNFRPKPVDVSTLIGLNLRGLECWNQPHLEIVQSLLRRHLVNIFEYDFPAYTSEIIRPVLREMSEHKFSAEVLQDLLNSFYKLANCPADDVMKFASSQAILTLETLTQLMECFSIHFSTHRKNIGLHGLYPNYATHCDNIRHFIRTLSFAFVDASIRAYVSIMPESLANMMWQHIWPIFSPWIVPYYLNEVEVPNWMQQLAHNRILLPWSKNHVARAVNYLQLFTDVITHVINTVPSMQILLGFILTEYETSFANDKVAAHVLDSTHDALLRLPWEEFLPTIAHVNELYRIFQQFLPSAHEFLAKIFLRVNWSVWLRGAFESWSYDLRQQMMSTILSLTIKVAMTLSANNQARIIQVLNEGLQFPWMYLDPMRLEVILDWFIMSTDPLSVLQMPGKTKPKEIALLRLLFVASGFGIESRDTQTHTKRILYVRTVTRHLRGVNLKHQTLMSTQDGIKAFNAAIADLMNSIEASAPNHADREAEIGNFMTEFLSSLPTQTNQSSRMFVDSLIAWQISNSPQDSTLAAILSTLNTVKPHSLPVCLLMETTIGNYLKQSETTDALTCTTWLNVMQRTGMLAPNVIIIVQSNLLLCLHLYALQQLKSMQNLDEKIVFLQNVYTQLETFTTVEKIESKWFLVVGLIVQLGMQHRWSILLLQIARSLQSASSRNEFWGEGILDAIGLRKDSISSSKRILSRCLACYIFSAFDEASVQEEFKTALSELRQTIAAKKYADVRTPALEVIGMLAREEATEDTRPNVAKVIRLFYRDHFLDSVEDVWK